MSIVKSKPLLQIIIGSTRPGRVGASIAAWFAEQARADGQFEVEVVDLAEVNLPVFDEPHHPRLRNYTHEHTKAWSAIVDRADAIVFVNPEYNHSVNGALKNAIDFLSQEWAHKPVGFVSYGGVSGGLRAVQVLKQIVTALRMYPISGAVAIQMAAKQLNGQGEFVPTEAQNVSAAGIFTELAALTTAVTALRAPRVEAAA
jgi:NAD(P)H-dependent FMN reductase